MGFVRDRRVLLLTAALVSCTFDPAGLVGGGDDGVGDDDVVVPDARAGDFDAALDPDAADVPLDATPDGPPPMPFCENDADLIACFEFEAGGADGSAYNNDATLSNATTPAGQPGHGLALSVGATSLVSVADSASLEIPGPITVELWLRADAVPPSTGNARAGLLDHNGQWGFFLLPNLAVRCSMAGGTAAAGGTVVIGQWTHVACVYDRNTIQLYQDGVAILPAVNATAANPLGTSDGIRIGQDSPSGDPLIGMIDEVRIWQVERTAAEICAAAGC